MRWPRWVSAGRARTSTRDRVGLLGHSEGALIAPMAGGRTPDVAFVVMLAGPGVTGEESCGKAPTS